MTKKLKIVVLVCCVMLLGGCGNSYLVDKEKNNIIYEKTGQTLPNDILCKPSDVELLKLYQKYDKQLKISVDKLPTCSNFKINSNKSSGLWEGIFVKPLAYLIIQLERLVKNYGLSVIILGILIRLLLLPFSIKTQAQSENMKKLNPELQAIERKYKDKTDNESMMAKSQEMMILYKKYNFNPFSSCLLTFIQLPLFFAFFQALNRIPAIFEDSLFGMYLGTTPMIGIKSGEYIYIILVLLVFGTTYFSFRKTMTATGNKEQDDQMKYMLIFMLVFIGMASFSLSTAVALYWVSTNGFIALQNFIIKKVLDKKPKQKNKRKENKKVSIKEKANKKRG